jgi:hypothetical protein
MMEDVSPESEEHSRNEANESLSEAKTGKTRNSK